MGLRRNDGNNLTINDALLALGERHPVHDERAGGGHLCLPAMAAMANIAMAKPKQATAASGQFIRTSVLNLL